MSELRTLEDVEAWLGVGLVLRRVESDVTYSQITQAIAQCANDLASLPPPAVIIDILSMLNGGRQISSAYHSSHEVLKSAINLYADDVVARFMQNALYDDILAAYAHAA